MRTFILIFAASLSFAAFADGDTILTEKCSRCHATPDPQSYSVEKWHAMVDEMAPNAQLNDEEIQILKALNQ